MPSIHLVDNDPDLLKYLRLILERQGYEVRTDSNAMDALEYLRQDQPLLIISDVDMPEMSGFRFFQKVRQMDHLEQVPFVFLSGKSEHSDLRRGMELGVDDYLFKPVNPEEVLAAIKSQLHKHKGRQLNRSMRDHMRQEMLYRRDQQVALICHDLGNVMGSIQLISTLLSYEKDSLNQDLRDTLDDLELQSQKGLDMLQNIMAWLRERLENKYIDLQVLKLAPIAQEVVDSLSVRFKDKNLKLKVEVPSGIQVQADPTLLSSLLYNLLHNASKYTPSGGEIRLSAENTGSKFVQIHVVDTGCGMSKAQLHNLFRFSTTSTPGTAGEKGRGLGLILCRDMVEQMGGEMRVESQLNQGSRFSLLLEKA